MFNQYAAGRKIYSNGSYAPTRGQVDPNGYMQRELRKRQQVAMQQGNDGQSDRRSGIAADRLRNLVKMHGGKVSQENKYNMDVLNRKLQRLSGAEKVTPHNGGRTGNEGPGGVTSGDRGGRKPPTDHGGVTIDDRNPGTSVPNPTQPPTPVGQPQIPTVKINANGQLDLPYDANWSWDLLNKKEQMNFDLLGLQQQAQQQALEYAQMQRQAGQEFEDVQRGTLNSAAGRGMAFSSGYGHDVATNATNFNNYMNDLNQGNALFNQGIAGERMGIENSFNDFIRKSILKMGQGLEGSAGDLGYGQGTAQPTVPNVKVPKPKPKKNDGKKNDGKKNSGNVAKQATDTLPAWLGGTKKRRKK